MRKYENVDVIAALGAVVELNTANYKSDFKYDIDMFKAAARNPDGENNRFLWLSRPFGTYCFHERDVYIKDTAAFNYWNGSATILGKDTPFDKVIVNDRVLTYAVDIKGTENGRIKGDIYELDYPAHIRQLNRVALPKHTVTAKHEDGTTLTLPHAEYDGKRERLAYQHGKVIDFRANPENADTLRIVLTQAREQREKEARPAVFKLRTSSKKPSIRKQLAEDKAAAAAPKNAAVKTKSNDLEV